MAKFEVAAAQRMTRLVRHIDRNLGERLTLAEMAAILRLSPYHLAHVFKQATELAPHQYLIRRRVARARHFLESTDLPIAEIALLVGCASQSHFSALFHRATGMTPLAYRTRNRPAASPPPAASLRYTAREAAGKLDTGSSV